VRRETSDQDRRSQIQREIEAQAPDLHGETLEVLADMYSSTALPGTESDVPVPMHPASRVSIAQGAAMRRMMRSNAIARSLEVGCAYGFSTVWMVDAVADMPGGRHVAVDPFERVGWGGVGLRQVARLTRAQGKFDCIEDYSYLALPRLIRSRRTFQFVFIDGNHRFDDVVVDFYLADMVLEVGGLMGFDDMWMPSVRAAVDFIAQNRAYERLHQPEPNIAVFVKQAPDRRPWDHFNPFAVPTG
jgi:predicted O-methyltransferase YrrM